MKTITPIDRDEAAQIEAMNNFFEKNTNAEKDLQSMARPYLATSTQTVLERIAREQKVHISLRSNAESIQKIKAFAKSQGVPYQTFLNAYIDEIAEQLTNIQ